ncbi:hypothetical protein RFF05_06260 [Bengtsoniella intestinalis]|uniref:hypothetical protein n=1 Tax=Bengtsoniella intestinalis TaxID=3073143 RepID=UPI00391F20C1
MIQKTTALTSGGFFAPHPHGRGWNGGRATTQGRPYNAPHHLHPTARTTVGAAIGRPSPPPPPHHNVATTPPRTRNARPYNAPTVGNGLDRSTPTRCTHPIPMGVGANRYTGG